MQPSGVSRPQWEHEVSALVQDRTSGSTASPCILLQATPLPGISPFPSLPQLIQGSSLRVSDWPSSSTCFLLLPTSQGQGDQFCPTVWHSTCISSLSVATQSRRVQSMAALGILVRMPLGIAASHTRWV